MNIIEQNKEEKLWNRQYLQCMLVNFFLMMNHYMNLTLLPLFALYLGGNNTHAGLMTGVFTIFALMFRPVFGSLLDTKGRRPVIILGIVILLSTSVSYNFSDSIFCLIVLRLLNGVGFSAGTTALSTIVSDFVPAKRMAEGFGYFLVTNTIAQAIGPLLGLSIIQHTDFDYIFIITSIFAAVGMVFALLIKCKKLPRKEIQLKSKVSGSEGSKGSRLKGFVETSTIAPAIVLSLLASSNGGVQTFLSKYAFSLGIEDIGIFFTTFALLAMVSRLVSGKLSNKYGLGITLLISMAILFVSQVILVFAECLSIFIIAAVFYGLAQGIMMPNMNTIIVMMASAEKKGAAVAVYFSSIDIGMGLGSVIWGVISQQYGYTSIYLSSSICCFFAIILYFLVLSKRIIAAEKSI